MIRMRHFMIALALFASACTPKIAGELQVDGALFAISGCRSGQALGFSGVLFQGQDGRTIRVLANPDGTCGAALFPAGATIGDNLGTCGQLAMQAQPSRINNIVNIKGMATLTCDAAGHKVIGSVKFENCH